MFALLAERHREQLLHREMVAAFTTAAVVNGSFCRPEESVKPVDYMPNHNGHAPAAPELSDEEKADEQAMNMLALRIRMQWKKDAQLGPRRAEKPAGPDERPGAASGGA